MLYKFMPLHSVSDNVCLQNSYLVELAFMSLYSPKPETFNDPWDVALNFASADNKILKERLGADAFQKGHFGEGVSLNTIKRINAHDNRLEILEEFFPHGSNARYIYDYVSKVGISCLSKAWNSPLMWSHYSKGHSGICFGLDFDVSDNGDLVFADVIYSEKPPKMIKFEASHSEVSTIEKLHLQFSTKSYDWQYENECRIINPDASFIAATPSRNEFEPNGTTSGNYRIREIIVGTRVEDKENAFAFWRQAVAASSTKLINTLAGRGLRLKQHQADDLIERSILDVKIFQITGVSEDYRLIRDELPFPTTLLSRPILPLPW